ncbi:MAG: hypothetical protein AB1489_40915 [Acidobacteriota bacterium]
MISAILILFFSLLGQENQAPAPPEYGDITELKQLQRVYIYTDDRDAYYRIAKEIGKYKDLQEVDKISEAEFVLVYYGNRTTFENYSNEKVDSVTGYGSVDTKTEKGIGIMKVLVQSSNSNSVRIVWQIEKGTRLNFGRDPEVKCTKEFIKQLKKVKQEK